MKTPPSVTIGNVKVSIRRDSVWQEWIGVQRNLITGERMDYRSDDKRDVIEWYDGTILALRQAEQNYVI